MSDKEILLIEAFCGGSHKQLMDLLYENLPDTELVSLPGKKWPWKARTAALYLSQVIPQSSRYRTLFTSSVLNLSELISLRPDLAPLRKVLYFHENQLVYPVRKHQDRDFQYGYNQIISSLVADEVVFNSAYNMESFLSSINTFLKLIPDHRPHGIPDTLRPKCHVLHFPVAFPQSVDCSSEGGALPMETERLQTEADGVQEAAEEGMVKAADIDRNQGLNNTSIGEDDMVSHSGICVSCPQKPDYKAYIQAHTDITDSKSAGDCEQTLQDTGAAVCKDSVSVTGECDRTACTDWKEAGIDLPSGHGTGGQQAGSEAGATVLQELAGSVKKFKSCGQNRCDDTANPSGVQESTCSCGPEKTLSSSRPLHIVWPHRWEHDKNPETFFTVLYQLSAAGLDFRLSVLGEQFTDIPAVFSEARNRLGDRILVWGHQPSKTAYYRILQQADCVVSTAKHEFFGVAMLEAVYLGCYPLCPNRLVYPEIFPKPYLYNTDNQLLKKLREFCKKPEIVRRHTLQVDVKKYSWEYLESRYRDMLQ